MIVTKIAASNSKQDLYQVFIDNSFLCSISGNDLLEAKLVRESKITQEEIDDLLYRSLRGKLINSALNSLGVRPKSEAELRKNLKSKLYGHTKETPEYKNLNTSQIIDEVINKLTVQGFIDDASFARWLVNNRLSSKNPKSKAAIKHELQRKGISDELISEYTSGIDISSELEQAKLLAEKKLTLLKPRESDLNQLRAKVSRYLISRGYSWETVRSTVDSLLKPF